jgi:hypothetical protein
MLLVLFSFKLLLFQSIDILCPEKRIESEAFALPVVSQAWTPRRKCFELAKIYLDTNQQLQTLTIHRGIEREKIIKLVATKFNIDNREIKDKDGVVYRIKADVKNDGYLVISLINGQGQESNGVLTMDACQQWSGDIELKSITFSGIHYENLAEKKLGGQIVSMATEFLDGEIMANLIVESNTVYGMLQDKPKDLKELLESFGKYPIGRMLNKVGVTDIIFRYFPKGIVMSGLTTGVAVTDKTINEFMYWLEEIRAFALQVTIKTK